MSSHRRLLPLDGLRGLAVLVVFSFHMAGGTHSQFLALRLFGYVNKAGWAGVTLFFLLSGFLITGIVWDSIGSPHWVRNFYMRRTLRIFPLYFTSLLLVWVAAVAAGRGKLVLGQLWSPVLFLQDIPGPALNAVNALGSPLHLTHFWSLAVEEQFYLLWPSLLALSGSVRSAMRLCLAVIAASLLFRLALLLQGAGWNDQWGQFLLARAGEMALGAWLALAYRTPLWERLPRIARWGAPLGFLGFAVTSWINGSAMLEGRLQLEVGLPALTLAFAGILVLSLQDGAVARFSSNRFLRWLGSISFGVYIFHVLFGEWFDELAASLTHRSSGQLYLVVRLIVTAACTLVLAQLSFSFYERWFLSLKRYFPAGGILPPNRRNQPHTGPQTVENA